jgi:hypothetical protein
MALWKVMYADWEMECCGDPFAVGDEVSWPLSLREPEPADTDLSTVEGPVERRDVEMEGICWVIRSGSLAALWPGEVPAGTAVDTNPVRLTGLLEVDRHGPGPRELPPTTGTVRRIQMVTSGYRFDPAEAAYVRVPGERWLREVPACPKWFDSRAPYGKRAPAAGDHYRSESGVLVDLEIADG